MKTELEKQQQDFRRGNGQCYKHNIIYLKGKGKTNQPDLEQIQTNRNLPCPDSFFGPARCLRIYIEYIYQILFHTILFWGGGGGGGLTKMCDYVNVEYTTTTNDNRRTK